LQVRPLPHQQRDKRHTGYPKRYAIPLR